MEGIKSCLLKREIKVSAWPLTGDHDYVSRIQCHIAELCPYFISPHFEIIFSSLFNKSIDFLFKVEFLITDPWKLTWHWKLSACVPYDYCKNNKKVACHSRGSNEIWTPSLTTLPQNIITFSYMLWQQTILDQLFFFFFTWSKTQFLWCAYSWVNIFYCSVQKDYTIAKVRHKPFLCWYFLFNFGAKSDF